MLSPVSTLETSKTESQPLRWPLTPEKSECLISSPLLSCPSHGRAMVLSSHSLGWACADERDSIGKVPVRPNHFLMKLFLPFPRMQEPPGWFLHFHKGKRPTHWCGHLVPVGRKMVMVHSFLIRHVVDVTVTQHVKNCSHVLALQNRGLPCEAFIEYKTLCISPFLIFSWPPPFSLCSAKCLNHNHPLF